MCEFYHLLVSYKFLINCLKVPTPLSLKQELTTFFVNPLPNLIVLIDINDKNKSQLMHFHIAIVLKPTKSKGWQNIKKKMWSIPSFCSVVLHFYAISFISGKKRFNEIPVWLTVKQSYRHWKYSGIVFEYQSYCLLIMIV